MAAMLLLALFGSFGELLTLKLVPALAGECLACLYSHLALLCKRLLRLRAGTSVRFHLFLYHPLEPFGIDALRLPDLDLHVMGKAQVIPVVAYEAEYLGRGGLGSEDMLSHTVGTVVFLLDEADPERLLEADGELAQTPRDSSFMYLANMKEGQPRRQVTDGMAIRCAAPRLPDGVVFLPSEKGYHRSAKSPPTRRSEGLPLDGGPGGLRRPPGG